MILYNPLEALPVLLKSHKNIFDMFEKIKGTCGSYEIP